MKNKWARILMILSGLLLVSLFFFPMWKVTLIAPQYPDGVQMHIYINKIGGRTPGTLQNINILNHYIGMKKIEPDSIKELTYFPYIVIFFIAWAIIVGLLNWKPFYLMWLLVFSIGLMLAMYDFYLWEYDYGHTLASNAPMKFEGESFQPPLFGSKILLNFVAKSYPHIGGYLTGLSVLCAAFATKLRYK